MTLSLPGALVLVAIIAALTALLIVGRRTAAILLRQLAALPLLTALGRRVMELGPYALALLIFAIVMRNANLNTVAQRYADQLFTVALVMIKTGLSAVKPPDHKG